MLWLNYFYLKFNSIGGQGVRNPLENHKALGFLVRILWKIKANYQAGIHCWAIIGPLAKHQLDGVPLGSR